MTTDLSQFSFEEQRRLLDLRPDCAAAAVLLQSILSSSHMEPQRVDIREDEGIVAIDFVFTFVIDDEPWRASGTVTAPLTYVTRKQLSYGMRIEVPQAGERIDVVAAEGWHSELYPIGEGGADG